MLNNSTISNDAYDWSRQLYYKLWCLQVIIDNSAVKYDAYKWS